MRPTKRGKKKRGAKVRTALVTIAAVICLGSCAADLGAANFSAGFTAGGMQAAAAPFTPELPASWDGGESGPSLQETSRAGLLDVPFIDQREKYPTGCESVSAVMALRYFGVDVTVDGFIDSYLPMGNAPYESQDGRLVGCSPWEAFLGDPRTAEGWGCYSTVIQEALERLLEERGIAALSVKDLSGSSLSALCGDYVDRGVPVLIWATIDMEEPEESTVYFLEGTGEEFIWVYPMHCLVLVGHDENGFYFNDPMAGKDVFYGRQAVERAYAGLGEQALCLVQDE